MLANPPRSRLARARNRARARRLLRGADVPSDRARRHSSSPREARLVLAETGCRPHPRFLEGRRPTGIEADGPSSRSPQRQVVFVPKPDEQAPPDPLYGRRSGAVRGGSPRRQILDLPATVSPRLASSGAAEAIAPWRASSGSRRIASLKSLSGLVNPRPSWVRRIAPRKAYPRRHRFGAGARSIWCNPGSPSRAFPERGRGLTAAPGIIPTDRFAVVVDRQGSYSWNACLGPSPSR